AISPVIEARENVTSYAVSHITMFGLTGMILHPVLGNILVVDDPIKAGLFLGTAIHDTAQVTGSALISDQMYDTSTVVAVATVTKLTSNIFIIVIIPFSSYLFFNHKYKAVTTDPKTTHPKPTRQ